MRCHLGTRAVGGQPGARSPSASRGVHPERVPATELFGRTLRDNRGCVQTFARISSGDKGGRDGAVFGEKKGRAHAGHEAAWHRKQPCLKLRP